MYEIADYLGISLAQVSLVVRDKEALVDLPWDRADAKMLSVCSGDEFHTQSTEQQPQNCMMTWLKALHPNQKTVKEMLLIRLEPGHLHIQIPTLIRVSQTVQWIRELTRRNNTFVKRAIGKPIDLYIS
ncbi:MAG: hypothetical protein WEB02_00005 [Methylophaga sp.]